MNKDKRGKKKSNSLNCCKEAFSDCFNTDLFSGKYIATAP